jgi:predicted lipoprotein with Yx(FWY)xxD motif
MRIIFITLAVAAALAVPTSGSAAARASVAARASRYERTLFDGRGFALYTFTRDPRSQGTCAGVCAKKWPPDIVSGRPAAGIGVKGSLLRTTRRSDGRLQATYVGRPLYYYYYYYIDDQKPGQILCQGVSLFGGVWLVVQPDGKLVR